MVRIYRNLNRTFHDTGRIWLWLNIPVRIKRVIYSYQLDLAIKKCIREKFVEIKAAQKTETKQTKDRSILSLALQDTDILDDHTLQVTADQVKSFLFAGHDTTSILLQRLFYAFSLHPKVLATLRAELDTVFGDSDPQHVFLAHPDETLRKLTYTSACIKEALRLWPPAATARMAPPGTGFKVRTANGDEICLDGTILYSCHYLIQRDPAVYGETANEFIPERWIGDSDTSSRTQTDGQAQTETETSADKIPVSAWRAFERGPRSCIGQELANLEARVILACVMGRFDFEKVGVGEVEVDEEGRPVVDAKGVYKTRSELFNV
ncbi:cytochrome P450 [Amniculicola lignicola CBS 123094]|uniref:Cytochrome P450 n=1 Tax=Amniculicola lignicola CBS 123094 TaxID=1392246 RepID=A0A6A5WNR1_9PLEO|nr:cytochrome P450 [Amniculicola lignicola CBS 123094]